MGRSDLGRDTTLAYADAMTATRRVRPREGRVIAGVAAGLADRFGMSRQTMRILFVISMLLPGPQILVYIILWLVIPEEA